MADQDYNQKPYPHSGLDGIRQRIDALDNQMHDILMERAELVLQIGEEKRKSNLPVVQPAREARMIRRLLGRHHGPLPQMAVVRIWRELVGAVSLLQTGLSVAVSMDGEAGPIWDMARDYFGSCLPMDRMGTPLSTIAAVREGKASFAVVPWPRDEDSQPWWTYLEAENSDQRMQIIARLPHGDDPQTGQPPDYRALIVARHGFDESGDDRSFLLIQCDSGISRTRVVDSARMVGLEAISMISHRTDQAYQPALHWLEVEGFVPRGSDLCDKLADRIEDSDARVYTLGGYPVPPVYSKSIHPRRHDMPVAPIRKEESAE